MRRLFKVGLVETQARVFHGSVKYRKKYTRIYLLSDSLYKNLGFFVSFVLIYYLYPQHPNKLCGFKVAKNIGFVTFCQKQTLLAFATNNQNSHTQSM